MKNSISESPKFSHKEFITISTTTFGNDFELFKGIVNAGIDSHLEAFTESSFFFDCGRYYFHFHRSELPILLRRLEENGSDESMMWIEDIKNESN